MWLRKTGPAKDGGKGGGARRRGGPPPGGDKTKKRESKKLGYAGAGSGECDNPATPTPSRWVWRGIDMPACQHRGEEGRNRLDVIKIGVKCRRWWVVLLYFLSFGDAR